MPLTDSSVAVTQKIVDLLQLNKVALGLAEVYFGDQELIPEYPAACVESFTKENTMNETRRRTVTLRSGIMVYHGKIQSSEITKKETEETAEAIESFLHSTEEIMTLDGLVIFGYITSIEPGVAVREDVMIRASRLMWEGISKSTFF